MLVLLRWITRAQLGPEVAALVSAGITFPRSGALLLPLPNALSSCWFGCPCFGPFWFSTMEEITLGSPQLARVRFDSILFNVQVIFEVLEQADVVGRLLCAIRRK